MKVKVARAKRVFGIKRTARDSLVNLRKLSATERDAKKLAKVEDQIKE